MTSDLARDTLAFAREGPLLQEEIYRTKAKKADVVHETTLSYIVEHILAPFYQDFRDQCFSPTRRAHSLYFVGLMATAQTLTLNTEYTKRTANVLHHYRGDRKSVEEMTLYTSKAVEELCTDMAQLFLHSHNYEVSYEVAARNVERSCYGQTPMTDEEIDSEYRQVSRERFHPQLAVACRKIFNVDMHKAYYYHAPKSTSHLKETGVKRKRDPSPKVECEECQALVMPLFYKLAYTHLLAAVDDYDILDPNTAVAFLQLGYAFAARLNHWQLAVQMKGHCEVPYEFQYLEMFPGTDPSLAQNLRAISRKGLQNSSDKAETAIRVVSDALVSIPSAMVDHQPSDLQLPSSIISLPSVVEVPKPAVVLAVDPSWPCVEDLDTPLEKVFFYDPPALTSLSPVSDESLYSGSSTSSACSSPSSEDDSVAAPLPLFPALCHGLPVADDWWAPLVDVS
jgi:hypothetical protein